MPSIGVKEVIMKTFYSILYAVIRPETDEKIAVGLILSDGNKSLFDFSKTKLGAAKPLLGDDGVKFIQNYITAVRKTVKDSVKELNQQSIFEFTESRHPVINESYFNYLSVYNTNLVWFSKPLQIEIPVHQESFRKLFEKLVDEDYGKSLVKIELQGIRKIKSDFIPQVIDYFSHETEVTRAEFSGLITPVTIDLIGKNERLVFAQFLDMEKPVRDIKYGFYDIKELIEVVEDSKGFLVSSEPDKAHCKKQHLIWENIRNYSKINYLDISEVDRIKEYAEEHHVIPFFNE